MKARLPLVLCENLCGLLSDTKSSFRHTSHNLPVHLSTKSLMECAVNGKERVIAFQDDHLSINHITKNLSTANSDPISLSSTTNTEHRHAGNKEKRISYHSIISLTNHDKHAKCFYCSKSSKYPHRLVLSYIKRHGGVWKQASLSIGSQFPETTAMIQSKLEACVSSTSPKRPKSLLVIINPFGGKRKGLQIYHEIAEPLFTQAGIKLAKLVTERACQAYEHVLSLDLEDVDGIVAIGGDGTLNEIVHALAQRRSDGQFSRPPVKIGCIPGGSTNCINEVVSGVVDAETSVLQIISGETVGLDVIFLTQPGEPSTIKKVAFCSVAYGVIGDLLLRSENYRAIGPARYLLAGMLSFMHMKTYQIQMKYQLADVSTNPCDDSRCLRGCQVCANSRDNPPQPKGGEKELAGEFAFIQVVPNRCAFNHSKLGVSPAAHLGDGTMDLIAVSPSGHNPRLNVLRLMAIHSSSRDRFSHDFVSVSRISNLRLTLPPTNNDKGGSSHTVGAISMNEKPGGPTTEHSESSLDHYEETVNAPAHPTPTNTAEKGDSEEPRLHRLWNIDGELIEGDDLDMNVICQFMDYYAVQPCTEG